MKKKTFQPHFSDAAIMRAKQEAAVAKKEQEASGKK